MFFILHHVRLYRVEVMKVTNIELKQRAL